MLVLRRARPMICLCQQIPSCRWRCPLQAPVFSNFSSSSSSPWGCRSPFPRSALSPRACTRAWCSSPGRDPRSRGPHPAVGQRLGIALDVPGRPRPPMLAAVIGEPRVQRLRRSRDVAIDARRVLDGGDVNVVLVILSLLSRSVKTGHWRLGRRPRPSAAGPCCWRR